MVEDTGSAGQGAGLGADEALRHGEVPAGVDQFRQLINKYGSPVPGVGVDKMPELINKQLAGSETQVGLPSEQTGGGEGLLQGNPPSLQPTPGGRGSHEARADDARSPRSRLQETVEHSFGAGIGRGRPPVITVAMQERICTLLSVGFSRRQAAAYVEVDQSTIHRTAKRDPEFADRLKRSEEKATLQPMLTVIAEAQKNWRAAAWLLKHKASQPVVLTEEEKQEEHEQRLAEARRKAAVSQEWIRAMDAGSSMANRFPQATGQVGQPVQTVKVKKGGKGKGRSITRVVTTTGRLNG